PFLLPRNSESLVTKSGRRVLGGVAGAVAALLLALGLFVAFGADVVARKGIEKVARDALGARVDIRSLRLRVKGKAEFEGVRIGNPGGYQEPVALEIASLDAFLDPASLSGGKEIVIHDMLAVRPEFTVEFLDGTSNLAILVERLID